MFSFFYKHKKAKTKKPDFSTTDSQLFDILSSINLTVDVLFDVGAHEGRFVDAAINYCKPKIIYAFEPYSKSYDKLSKRFYESNVYCVQKGLYNSEGKKGFHVNAYNETNSILGAVVTQTDIDNYTKTVAIEEIELVTLDSFCKENDVKQIDLLKIDVQGVGFQVLAGGESMLREKRISCIVCEVEFIEIYKGEVLYHDIASYLYSYGYHLYTFHNIHFDINGRSSWADAVFIKSDNL